MVHSPTSPMGTSTRASEVAHKLTLMRNALNVTAASGIRLRGTDWFSWATAGASHTVLLAAETGVAEILVTPDHAWMITDEIEAERLRNEELPGIDNLYSLQVHPWADADRRTALVQEATDGGKVLSDRPTSAEVALPHSLIQHKRTLLPSECDRYRQVGRLASEAMLETLQQAQPDWTEYQLAGAGAAALWKRGLHPALTLAAGERRLPLYRHATASDASLGRIAMLVFCARGSGLYANLTRFVAFGDLSAEHEKLHEQVRQIEAEALDQCKLDTPLNHLYDSLKQTYEQHGYPHAIYEHHQGGTTGYLAREIVVTPKTTDRLHPNTAIALNPSLPGAKIEDTFILLDNHQLENITLNPHEPTVEVRDRHRPIPVIH